jgi:hypothetical protein
MTSDSTTPTTGSPGRLGRILDGPLTGLSPWIVLGVLEGEGWIEWAAGIALALSVVFLVADLVRGRSLKLLAVVDVIFFAGLLILVLLINPNGKAWLETWIGEISNIALVLVAVGSMLVRMPFTLQYAHEQVDPKYWHMPTFLHTNYVITGVWAGAFLVSAIAGFYGDAVLQNSNNIWTGWVIQVGAIIVALQFSEWYPDVARARVARGQGRAVAPPSLVALLDPLARWLVPIGILSLVLDGGPTWLGITFIVAGIAVPTLLRQVRRTTPASTG